MINKKFILFKPFRRFWVFLRSYILGMTLGFKANKFDVFVVSPGGVATTFFMEFLSDHLRINDPYDRDRLKHVACPPLFSRGMKFIYIYGKPQSIILSLAQRGYLNYQIHKNGKYLFFNKIDSLDDYINTGSDMLRLKASLAAWKRLESKSDNILTLDFEDIWKQKAEWAEFLGLSDEVMDSFPSRRFRYTDNIQLTDRQSAALRKIYSVK